MPTFPVLARQLSEIARGFYARGWTLATSGNLSAVVNREPLRLAITASGIDKGKLTEEHILEIDDGMTVIGRFSTASGTASMSSRRLREVADSDDEAFPGGDQAEAMKPSDESLLHIYLARYREAGAVLHTHSVWSTVLSEVHAAAGGISFEGYEMLKGLEGVKTHEHREWLPIIDNAQDMASLAIKVADALSDVAGAHGFLLRGHGLYAWGATLPQAKRHVETLEFLLEAAGRSRSIPRA